MLLSEEKLDFSQSLVQAALNERDVDRSAGIRSRSGLMSHERVNSL